MLLQFGHNYTAYIKNKKAMEGQMNAFGDDQAKIDDCVLYESRQGAIENTYT